MTAPYLFMPNEFAEQLSSFVKASLPSSIKITIDNKSSRFDFSLIIIWMIAIVTIILGALWTKVEFRVSLLKLNEGAKNNVDSNENLVDSKTNQSNNAAEPGQLEANRQDGPILSAKKNNNSEEQITTISVGYLSILFMLIFVVAILLLLYFFYDYMSK